jgi:Predicted membrane protein (DUF2232)
MGRIATIAITASCGVVAAALYLAAALGSSGALILVYLTQLPLFIAGLWLGTSAASIAGLTATVVMLAAGDMLAAGLFAVLNPVPVVLLVRQALLARQRRDGGLDWYPPGLLIGWLTGLGLAGIIFSSILLGGPHGIEARLHPLLGRLLGEIGDRNPADRHTLAGVIVMVMPGVTVASWMAMVVANGTLAQGLLSHFRSGWRPSPDLATLALPLWVLIALALASSATLIGGTARFLGVNAIIVLAVPFCLGGLAVLHGAARRLTHPAPALVSFYVFAALFGWPLLVIAVVGLVESWLRLRRRLTGGGSIGGNLDD